MRHYTAPFPALDPMLEYLEGLSRRADLKTLERLLSEAGLSQQDLTPACFFDDQHYRRNKVASTAWFDLLVICWRPGQETLIHDHLGSSCAFKIIQGNATETVYERSGRKTFGNDLVIPRSSKAYLEGQICAAQDQDIHKITNSSLDQDLITLHIYSPALQMNFFELDTNAQSQLEHGQLRDGQMGQRIASPANQPTK